jgi:hypothetical protein
LWHGVARFSLGFSSADNRRNRKIAERARCYSAKKFDAALRPSFEEFYTLEMTLRSLVLLIPLLLAGCVNESASYAASGSDQALTVLVTQDYFWSRQAGVRLVASRLPDCQRQFDLGKAPLADLNVELFSTGPDTFLLRSGDAMWQVETQGCTKLPPPSDNVQAQPIGVFHLDGAKKLVFERAEGAVAASQ